MKTRRSFLLALITGLVAFGVVVGPALAEQLLGTVKEVDAEENELVVAAKETDKEETVKVTAKTKITREGRQIQLKEVREGDQVDVTHEKGVASKIVVKKKQQ